MRHKTLPLVPASSNRASGGDNPFWVLELLSADDDDVVDKGGSGGGGGGGGGDGDDGELDDGEILAKRRMTDREGFLISPTRGTRGFPYCIIVSCKEKSPLYPVS